MRLFIKKLKINKFDEFIKFKIINQQMPILGICVGMEVLFSKSYEKGEFDGLNLIKGCFKIIEKKKIYFIIFKK